MILRASAHVWGSWRRFVLTYSTYAGFAEGRPLDEKVLHQTVHSNTASTSYPSCASLLTRQYTSRTYRFSRFNALTYSVAASASSPPCTPTTSCKALSTSLAIRVASPHT